MKVTVKEIAEFIKESTEWLKKEDCGCCHYHVGDVCIVVGWMPGYDEDPDDGDIHSKSDPSHCINAGVRVESSYMQTDMDLDFNYLYWPNGGDCWDCDCTVTTEENYEQLAKWLLDAAEEMNKYVFEEDGKILGHKKYFELKNEILEDLTDKEDFEIMAARIADETELTNAEMSDLADLLEKEFTNFLES